VCVTCRRGPLLFELYYSKYNIIIIIMWYLCLYKLLSVFWPTVIIIAQSRAPSTIIVLSRCLYVYIYYNEYNVSR